MPASRACEKIVTLRLSPYPSTCPRKMPIQIFIDDRERNPKLLAALSSQEALFVTRRRLPWGDFVVEQTVTLERKTVDDFATSLIQGRLFSQAHRLQAFGGLRYCILEGDLSETRPNVRPEALRGAMIALTLKFGLPILTTADEYETARTLLYIGKQLASIDQGAVGNAPRKNSRKRTIQKRLLQQIPHVGSVRAERLLTHFGGIRAIANADKNKLASVEGIGHHAAEKIYQSLEEAPAHYGTLQKKLLI